MRLAIPAAVLALAVVLGGCGGDSSASCCLNKSYYSCGSSDAAKKCFDNSDTSGCSRDSSKDKSCE